MISKLIGHLRRQKPGKFQKPLVLLCAAGVVLLATVAAVWFFKVSVNPERVFWDTVNQGLRTRSVTIEARQTTAGSSITQTLQYSLGVTNIAHSYTHVKQRGTTVTSEMVGTPSADYMRYIAVRTDQKDAKGRPLNFAPILGVWAKSSSGSVQLFNQGILGVGLPLGGVALPVGNPPAATRDKLIRQIKQDVVYHADFKKATSKRVDGRLQYIYDVDVEPVAYASLMQRFSQAMGLHALDSLDPAAFKGQQATKMRLTVDVRAHRLVAAAIPATGASQTYGSYDVPSQFTVPAKTITVSELQQRLTHLQ